MSKLEQLTQQYKDTVDALNQETNEDAKRMQRAELEKIQAQIDAEKLQEVADEAAASTEALTLIVGGQAYDFREIISNEVEYQAAKVIISQWQYEQDQRRVREVEGAHERFRHETQQFQFQLDAARADYALNISDVEAKLKAATEELAEYKRREAAQAQASTPVATNMNADIAAKMAALKASRPAIYNKRQGDLKGTFYIATLLETGEDIEIKHLEIKQYREASDEEVARFREEQAAKAAEEALMESTTSDTVATIEPPQLPVQFQSDETDISGTSNDTTNGTVADGEDIPESPVTRAEFDALVHRVAFLEILQPTPVKGDAA